MKTPSDASKFPSLPGYSITEELHAGSRTVVYRGVQLSQQMAVVIKIMRQGYRSFSDLVQFRNQYNIVKNLNIPGIVRPLSLEPYENGYALVMADDGSMSVQQYVQGQRLTLTSVLAIARQLAEVLHHIHQNGVIHKGIKPANILIHPESQEVKLIDFSIASLLPKETQKIQNPNVLEGTLAYLAPEQTGRMNRGIDYRADFYALGVTLYELLTRQLPFPSQDPLEVVHCHIAILPVPPHQINQNIPPVVSALVMKLMAKNAEYRYQSALGLQYDLDRCWREWEETGKISEFELGERDKSDRFIIPEKLYGRAKEVQSLLEAFDRVAHGQSEIMLVAGFSGIGKTAVVNEVHKPITRQQGYFIKGKYDQFNRNIPFSGVVQALRDLMGQLLSESDSRLAQWLGKILAAVGDNGQVLIEVIPELEKIIGPQPTAPELSGTAAQNRFNLLFEKFIEVFTAPEHPLVMFLDDLQWADSASLQLLKFIINNEKGYFLLIGAYRDNEVSPVHPLSLTLAELKQSGKIVNTITLTSLAFKDMNELVADTLHCARKYAVSLTRIINQKTKGNPFFTTQFVKALHDEQLITFNWEIQHWQCDITQVKSLAITDDVVEFMAAKLRKLPKNTQNAIKLASCIGATFDLNTLAIVSEKYPVITAKGLAKALQEGLVIPSGKNYLVFTEFEANEMLPLADNPTYRFLHDRVQQASYSLIPEEEKPAIHLKIGQSLLQKFAEQEEKLFEIVGHLNKGNKLITNSLQRHELSQLNLKAGCKAKLSTAYAGAINYFKMGIKLLANQGWQQHYELMFTFHKELAEAEYLNGNFAKAEALIDGALNQAKSAIEKAELYHLRIVHNSIIGHYERAIDTSVLALKLLGLEVAPQTAPSKIETTLAEIKHSLESRSISSLVDLPEMDDREKRMIVQLLIALDPPTYITANFNLYILSTVKAVNFSIKYGNVPVSAKAYANYGFITGSVLGDYKSGYEFGVLALNVSQKFNHRGQKSQASLLLGSWLTVWSHPISGAAAINLEGYQDGLLGGEPQFAGYNLFGHSCNQLFQGVNLDLLSADIEKYLLLAKQTQNQLVANTLKGLKFFINPLLQTSNPVEIGHQEFVRRLEASQSLFALSIYHIGQMQLACINQEFHQGLVAMEAVQPILNSVKGFTLSANYYFYGALICLNANPEQAATIDWQQVDAHQTQIKIWAGNCPENFLGKYFLIEAERMKVMDNKAEAISLYDRAISWAKENKFIHEEALANELAAKFYLSWGKEKIAASYLQEAYSCYTQWGAMAKIADLAQQYPQLLAAILQHKVLPSQATNPINLVTQSGSDSSNKDNLSLDFDSIIKATQAISQEIDLDNVLSSLLRILNQNAGAETSYLLLRRHHRWVVVFMANQQEINKLNLLLDESRLLPQSLIYSVARNQAPMVFDNLSASKQFASDTYVHNHQPKSALCTPILRQGKLIGILYLENNLTVGAFTSDRAQTIQILTAQAAISIENARLYQELEDYSQKLASEVELKTEYLKQKSLDLEQALKTLQETQSQLIESEKMSALVKLVAGIAHEINNPLSFIYGNIHAAETYTHDLLSLLDVYQEEYPQPTRAVETELEEIDLDFVKHDYAKMFDSIKTGVKRIQNIIMGLQMFSGLNESKLKRVDLHVGLDNALMILTQRMAENQSNPPIQIFKHYGNLPKVTCYSSDMNQVFYHLLDNAIDALRSKQNPENLAITIETQVTPRETVKIVIADNGAGIPCDVVNRIFEPFFTTKAVGSGTGIGLSVSYAIIKKHGGKLTCNSTESSGAEFVIEIPIKPGYQE